MSGKIYRDELGEVENLSIFEQYPEFAKRLMIFTGIVAAGIGGIWYALTADKAVECGQGLNQIHREECRGDLYCIKEYRAAQCLEIWAEKKTSLPVTVTVWVDKKQMQGIGGQRAVVLSDQQPRRLAALAWDQQQKPDFMLRHMGVIAGGRAHNPADAYELPLPSKIGFQTIDPKNPMIDRRLLGLKHVVTFATSVGTPVYAMRAGTVVAKRDDQAIGGNRISSVGAENYLMIQHDDGTVAFYENLHKGSVVRGVGDKVEAQQLISVSGNSGYTEYPMLTVSVVGTDDKDRLQSFPMVFATAEGGRELAPFETVRAPENRVRPSKIEVATPPQAKITPKAQQTSTVDTGPKPISPLDLIKQMEKEQKTPPFNKRP